MKKFEEEIFGKVETIITQPGCSMTRKVWYKADDIHELSNDWVSPEDHQAEIGKRKQQYEEHQEIYSKTAKKLNEAELELSKLKSQLEKQQPEIPEVPQFVADWLDKKPLYAINGSIPVEIIAWSKKQTGYADLGMIINLLLKLKVNGYTVAKEKRFYLKNKLTGCYLFRAFGGKYGEGSDCYKLGESFRFTQQEIDSMAAESYEQIEVEE